MVPVVCTAALEAAQEARAAASGTVSELFVVPGTRVRKGQQLVLISAPELEAKSASARAELRQLEESRADAVAEASAARDELSERRKTVEGDKRLIAVGAIAAAGRDSDERALRQSEQRLQVAEAKLAAIDRIGDDGTSALTRTAGEARALQARLQALDVRAPVDGIAYGLPDHVGDVVALGQRVVAVADATHRRVRLRIDAPDVPRVAAGQTFTTTFEGLPDSEWRGILAEVSPALREVEGRQVGEAEGEIEITTVAPPYDARLSARIIVGERSAALVLPRAALQRDGDARYVWIEQAGRAVRRNVSIGLVGLSEVEVLSGLSEGEPVVVPTEGRIDAGARIAVRS
jgi:HlyD family secretion protein